LYQDLAYCGYQGGVVAKFSRITQKFAYIPMLQSSPDGHHRGDMLWRHQVLRSLDEEVTNQLAGRAHMGIDSPVSVSPKYFNSNLKKACRSIENGITRNSTFSLRKDPSRTSAIPPRAGSPGWVVSLAVRSRDLCFAMSDFKVTGSLSCLRDVPSWRFSNTSSPLASPVSAPMDSAMWNNEQ
jgi:hypothetical protein